METYLQLNDSLRELTPELPRVLQTAAIYMLEHPGEIATLSMRSIASQAGVSQPNFARLAKMLGFETYAEMREIYRKQVQRSDFNPYHLRAENLQRNSSAKDVSDLWEKFKTSSINNLTTIYDSIDPQYFSSVASLLNESEVIYLVGMQGSAQISRYANYIGRMASNKFQMVHGDAGILADTVFAIGPKDAMIVFSHQPCAFASIELAKLARERGATVIAVTDSPASPIALEADHVLLAPNQSPHFFESYVGMTALVETLVGFFTVGQPRSTVERIEKMEADRIRLGEYWQNEKG